MRIIDKQNDFYDYLQDSTDTLVFDRRGSFLLTKKDFCNSLYFVIRNESSNYRFITLQCGGTFWLLLATITKRDNWGCPSDYTIQLLDSWTNYNKPNELLKIDIISFNQIHKLYDYKINDFKLDRIKANISDLKDAINRGDFKSDNSLNHHTKTTSYKYSSKTEKQTLPLLKACGIGNIIDPQKIFCAIEEYFSIKKTQSETTEAKGATNNDKIIMHGFDTKTSFRGKR